MARSQSAAGDTDPLTLTAEGDPATDATPIAPTSPPRFKAPGHVSAIILSTGREVRVKDGVLTVPADLSDDEWRQIVRAGFIAA